MISPTTTKSYVIIQHAPFHSIYFSLFHLYSNKDENVHRFALSAIRWELLEREREFWNIIHGLPVIHSKYVFEIGDIMKIPAFHFNKLF